MLARARCRRRRLAGRPAPAPARGAKPSPSPAWACRRLSMVLYCHVTCAAVCPFILGNEFCERLAFYGCAPAAWGPAQGCQCMAGGRSAAAARLRAAAAALAAGAAVAPLKPPAAIRLWPSACGHPLPQPATCSQAALPCFPSLSLAASPPTSSST